MGVVHFLNVLNGDCSVIQHPSCRATVIDINNAEKEPQVSFNRLVEQLIYFHEIEAAGGGLNQKRFPVNPISYLQDIGVQHVHRFILTHPDMDHMGGLRDFFEVFDPDNFWDTDNIEEKEFAADSYHLKADWDFYQALRRGASLSSAKRLVLYDGAVGQFYNQNEDGSPGGDGLHVLAPTPEILHIANAANECNDLSYVLLYRAAGGGRILFAGDSHDLAWKHILANHAEDVRGVDLLIAPHHGRKSGRSYEFLDVVRPKLTFFGNARSEHLAYNAWTNRGLGYITNNRANCMIVDANTYPLRLYVTNRDCAVQLNPGMQYSDSMRSFFCGYIA